MGTFPALLPTPYCLLPQFHNCDNQDLPLIASVVRNHFLHRGDGAIQLYDLNGHSMAAFNLHEGTNAISLAHLNAGVYMLRAEGTVMKVVKK